MLFSFSIRFHLCNPLITSRSLYLPWYKTYVTYNNNNLMNVLLVTRTDLTDKIPNLTDKLPVYLIVVGTL